MRNIKIKILFVIILSLLLNNVSFGFLNFQFKNFNIAVGENSIKLNIIYPEIIGYSDMDFKNSFLIDMRFDFRTFKGIRFSPTAEWWSWGNFPKRSSIGVSNSISGLDFNFDLNHFIFNKKRFSPYLGTGLGFHFTYTDSNFPYEMFKDVPIVIEEITEYNFKTGMNFIAGSDFYVNDNVTIFSEIRFEYAPGLNQFKFLIGISTF